MTITEKPKKSGEEILAAADADTDDKALSKASKTEPPVTDRQAKGASLESRVAAMEADIAYLRSIHAWPERPAE